MWRSLSLRVPPDDNRERYVCERCEHIHYQNPRIVAGALVTREDRVLLCRRAIEPRRGYWTLPAGFLENGETPEEGAARETWEEARCQIDAGPLYTLFSLPHISQVYMFFRAELGDATFAPGMETLECGLFTPGGHPLGGTGLPGGGQDAHTLLQRSGPGGVPGSNRGDSIQTALSALTRDTAPGIA